MHQTINQTDFIQAFMQSERKNQFSYDALCELYNFYEQLEDDTGESIELDIIAICCDWTENTPDEIRADYSHDVPAPDMSDDETWEWLQDHTTVLVTDGGTFVYMDF